MSTSTTDHGTEAPCVRRSSTQRQATAAPATREKAHRRQRPRAARGRYRRPGQSLTPVARRVTAALRFLAPAITTFLLTLALLLSVIDTVPQHGDEGAYAYTAARYGHLIARLDFSRTAHDGDVSWDPSGYWSLTQPMGTRFVYALSLGLSGLPAPARAWNYLGTQPPDTMLTPRSLVLLRLVAAGCAALGLALISVRFRWRGTAAAALLLVIPHVRPDLVRAWAEGPLLLGFGLCALLFGTRWFGAACGLAATAKLTALGLWPLLLWPGSYGRTRWTPVVWGVLGAAALWTVLTPPAWFAGGPLYLPAMLLQRLREYGVQSSLVGRPGFQGVGGWFFATRYLLPLELAATLALSCGAAWLWRHWSVHRVRAVQRSSC